MNKKEIEQILKDYHWMLNSIKIMREQMDDEVSSKTAMYGLDASLPRPKGNPGDPVFADVVRRSKHWKKIEQYEKKVAAIQKFIDCITDEREYEVLNWIMEGKGYRWIARHMGLSEAHIRRIKDSIVDQIFKKSQMSQTTQRTQRSQTSQTA